MRVWVLARGGGMEKEIYGIYAKRERAMPDLTVRAAQILEADTLKTQRDGDGGLTYSALFAWGEEVVSLKPWEVYS